VRTAPKRGVAWVDAIALSDLTLPSPENRGDVNAFDRDPNYGTATKDRGPREIQYALKFTF